MDKQEKTLKKEAQENQKPEPFNFHYVVSPTGEISGVEVMRQSEDAINDVGKFAKGAYDASQESVDNSEQALKIAQEAKTNSLNATASAESAIEKVETLSTIVKGYDQKISDAVTQSQSAVQVAGEGKKLAQDAANAAIVASNASQDAKNAAIDASTKADQAAKDSQNAATQAEEARNEAEVAKQEAQISSQASQQAAQQAQNTAEAVIKATEEAYALRVITQPLSNGQSIDTDLLSPQGNIKVGDSIVDSNGQVFQIEAIVEGDETTPETATIGNAVASFADFVSFAKAQALTEEQKAQARANIGAANDTEVLRITAQSLTESSIEQILKNLGVIDALKELIVEYGGTVPTE